MLQNLLNICLHEILLTEFFSFSIAVLDSVSPSSMSSTLPSAVLTKGDALVPIPLIILMYFLTIIVGRSL